MTQGGFGFCEKVGKSAAHDKKDVLFVIQENNGEYFFLQMMAIFKKKKTQQWNCLFMK
jgi:hypothetical protein